MKLCILEYYSKQYLEEAETLVIYSMHKHSLRYVRIKLENGSQTIDQQLG